MNTRQTLSQRRARLSYWIPLIIASILLSVNDSTVAAQDDLPPQTNDDSAEVSEPIKSRITSLKEEIEKLKQFNEFVNQYNQLMKERRFAEAELVGKKAKDLQTNEPQAILMVEKAKMHRQLAFNESVRKRKEGSGEDISSAMEPVIDTEQIKIFNLKNSNANDIQLIIAQLFDGTTTTISVDERTNALIIRANESQLREIEAILLRLDSTETAARNSVSTDLPSIAANEPVISIAEYRSRLDALEQPVLQLAEQVRAAETKHGKDHPDATKLRADLRALVQQTFTARQEIQRAELAEFNRRLQRMQQSIETRDRIAEKIADRRVEELLDPNIRWTTTTPAIAPLVSRDELVAELNMKTIEVDQGAIQETTQSPEPSWLELLPTIDAILEDIEDLQKRTPLKLLMQFKDKPLIQISDDFNESFRNLREIVEGNQPPEKVKEGFAATEESSKIFISNFRRFNSEGMINALREIEDGIATLKILIDSDQRIGVLPGLRDSNAALLQKLQGKWAIKESASGTTNDSLVERVAPMGEVHIEGRLITVPFVKGDAPTDIPMLMELQAPGNPQGVKITIDPNGEAFVALGIIECDGDHLRLCFGQCVGKGEIPDETSRPLVFAPGSSAAFLKCGRISTESNAFFPASSWRPRSDAEKAIARLVLAFNRDQTKRVPAVMIQHGNKTIAVTAGPATIVPDDVPPAIDREFLEFYDRDDVATQYSNFSASDLHITIANENLTEFTLEDRVTLHAGDALTAILMHGQEDFEVTPDAARVTAVEQEATFELPSHNIKHQYTGLVQIDQRLPEGTPLFQNGKLAGLTLLGTRFMKDGVEGSYVVPASRIAEVVGELKSK